jgi:hypothetical protein
MNEDQRARADLLRAYETTTLTKANFCALKGWTEDALDQALALAREENRARRPDVTRQYSPPATRSSR